MKTLKWNSYENSKLKFIWTLKIHLNTREGFFETSLQIIWILKHCLLSGNDNIFRNRGSGSTRTFELRYLAILRQVHSCSCPLAYFTSLNWKHYIPIAFEQNIAFYKMVGAGIMDFVAQSEYRVVEIPLYREWCLGLNNNCTQSFQSAI